MTQSRYISYHCRRLKYWYTGIEWFLLNAGLRIQSSHFFAIYKCIFTHMLSQQIQFSLLNWIVTITFHYNNFQFIGLGNWAKGNWTSKGKTLPKNGFRRNEAMKRHLDSLQHKRCVEAKKKAVQDTCDSSGWICNNNGYKELFALSWNL